MIIATWNLENLFSPHTEFGVAAEPTFDEKIAGIAATIQANAVDVVAVQEIGDQGAFDRLLSELGAGWDGNLSTHFTLPHSIRVGVASKLQIVATSEHSAIPAELQGVPTDDDGGTLNAMGRGVLHAKVRNGAEDIDVVSVHLKSKLVSYPNSRFQPNNEGERARYASYALMRRTAEAAAVRGFADGLVNAQGNTHPLVVLGDMNDEVNAATTQILNGPSGSEIGTDGENRPDGGDAWRLFNLAPRIPAHERFSRVFRGRGELIDHIFVTNALRTRVTNVNTRTGGEALPSITENPNVRRNSPFSDHAMVLAEIA